MYSFAKTSIGYRHLLNKKPCQDFSILYQEPNRTIITCCDGHGGDIYIRSNVGSQLASKAIINVLSEFDKSTLLSFENKDSIKLKILCEWNRLIDEHLNNNPIRQSELRKLNHDQIEIIRENYVKVYGTTLTGAMLIDNLLIVVGIGDSEVILVSKGKLYKPFEDNEAPVGNFTYSMCQDDAFEHMHIAILDFDKFDGVILCTDGLINPYQNYQNFNQSFIKPLIKVYIEQKNNLHVEEHIDKMAYKIGNGDDVSIAFILKDQVSPYYYNY